MYQVSNDFLSAMHSFIIQPVLRGTVGNIPFTHDDILDGSFRCCNQNVSVNDVKIGGVFVGELELTFLSSVATSRGDWYGKKIRCEYGLAVGDEIIYIPCPSYEYVINEATWTENGLKIVAYDNMLLLDKSYEGEQSSGMPYSWLSVISRKTGVPLGVSELQVASMPNGNKVINLFSTDKIETYRDLLSYLASVLGGFATINREGKLIIKQFNGSVVDVIDAQSRFSGCSFSDYTTRYTGLSVMNAEDSTTSYYHVNPDDGLTMKLGNNPFLQLGAEEIKKEMRLNILNSIQSFSYVPFKVSMLGCCVYDLGDCIRFTDGIAENSVGCIMSYDFGLNDYAVAGFGDNPALESAQSKTEKNITGLVKTQSSEQLTTTTLTNIDSVDIGSSWNKVGSLTFVVSKKQTILFHGVSKHDLSVGGSVRYKYLLNDNELDFIHECKYDKGIDTTTLFIPFQAEPNIFSRLDIYVQSDNAVGVIDSINLRGALLGSGMVVPDWDGTLSFNDTFNLELHGAISHNFGEVLEVNAGEIEKAEFEETFVLDLVGSYNFAFGDQLNITTITPTYRRITEDGVKRYTENGDYRITE